MINLIIFDEYVPNRTAEFLNAGLPGGNLIKAILAIFLQFFTIPAKTTPENHQLLYIHWIISHISFKAQKDPRQMQPWAVINT
jgi:hypothetical protein